MGTSNSCISVLIATKTSMVGELFAAALNRKSQFQVVTNVTTARDVREASFSHAIDVALISAALADGASSGLEALRQLRESAPHVKTILLLDSPDPKLIFEAFQSGVKGIFNPAESPFKALCRCVERVHAGQIWVKSRELADVLETYSRLAPTRVVYTNGMKLLTKREEQVVRLLGDGLQNREIAQELNLSEHTIKNYLFHIFDKLGVSSRVELILYAVTCTKEVAIDSDESSYARGEGADLIAEHGESSRPSVMVEQRKPRAQTVSRHLSQMVRAS